LITINLSYKQNEYQLRRTNKKRFNV